MSPLHRETLTVHITTDGDPDEDGVPTSTSLPREWGPCNAQQVSSTETRGGREVVVTKTRASGPLAKWIGSDAKVTRDGEGYRVDGKPAHFVGGALDHTELVLIAWEGE